MSTRINPDFYGAENTFITLTSGNVKTAPHNLNWYGNNSVYTGGDWDTTAAPWGIGRSSLSSNMIQVPTIGQEWTINQHENEKGNNPLYMYHNVNNCYGSFGLGDFTGASATWQNYARALFKCRYSPDAHTDGNSVISDLPVDDGGYITIADCYDNYPITYADYSKLRLAIRNIQYKPTNSDEMKRVDGLPALLAADDVDKITKITFDIYNPDRTQCGFYSSIGGVGLSMPDIFKTRYYGDVDEYVRPWRYNADIGNWAGSGTTEFTRVTSTDHFSYTTAWETLSSSDDVIAAYPSIVGYAMANISKNAQVFSDVSYHWEYGICPYMGAGHNFDIAPIQTGDTYTSGIVQTFAYMELDDYADNLTKTQAYIRAILHEVAFMGFAIIGDIFDSAENIGSNKVYLPVFDEHMITTGEFLSGSDSLNLPNSTWTDIFGSDMPEYDPDYEPEPPEPGEDDQGDLSNEYPYRYTNAGGLAQYVVDQGILLQLSAFLNGSYLPTSADLDADFKGTNPMDYIVSVQKYPFTLPNVGTSSDIYIGKQNTSLQGKKLFPDIGGLTPISINSASTFDFGSISIPYYFNDFRDYQSKIFLFMPFIGTDELDPRLYIGHDLSLVYRVDYNTGSVIAEIKRDGLTMETKNGTISITVPFLAANMGAYQNQLAQLAYSKDMTKIKGIGTALSAGFTMAAGASGTLSSGQFPLAAASNLAQSGVQLAANATQLSQLDYQIEHTAPQLGTISTAGAATAFFMDDRARIIIARPKMLEGYNSEQYSHTIGNACCKTGTLSAFSGFTQAATAILDDVHTKITNRQATEQERQLLRRTLQNGIYL